MTKERDKAILEAIEGKPLKCPYCSSKLQITSIFEVYGTECRNGRCGATWDKYGQVNTLPGGVLPAYLRP